MTSLVDRFLQKEFSYRDYNCFHFVRDVWLELTGNDLGDQTPQSPGVDTYNQKALLVANTLLALAMPEDPSIVLLQRDRLEPHVGVFYKGRVLHLNRKGAYYMPLSQVTPGYTTVGFYK